MSTRIDFLDGYRGFALLNMLLFHWYYDVTEIFNRTLPWFPVWAAYVWQQFIVLSFILVSGAVSNYAQHPQRRGVILCLWGGALTVVTHFFMPSELILFGVLSFLGLAMFLTGVLPVITRDKEGKKRQALTMLLAVLSLLGFALTQGLSRGYLGLYGHSLAALNLKLGTSLVYFILGLPGQPYISADYVPVLPHIFAFWLGRFAWLLGGKAFKTVKLPPALNFVGAHTLFIYLVHQPLIYGLCLLFLG